MSDFFADVVQFAVPIFAIASMIAVGLGNPIKKLLQPLKDYRLLAMALAANFVLVPILAWATSKVFSLDPGFETGLLIVSVAAGAPFLVKLTMIAKGSVPVAGALLVLLLVVTVGYLPLVLPFVVSGDVEVDPLPIAWSLIWTMLGPLAIALAVREWRPGWAQRIRPFVQAIITPALVVLVVSTVIANGERIIDIFGEGAIAAAFVLIGGSFAIGYFLGTPDSDLRGVTGLATAQRNMGAATVVATQSFSDDPNVLVMVVVTSVVAMAVLFPAAFGLGKRAEGKAPGTSSTNQPGTGGASAAGPDLPAGSHIPQARAGRKE